jgi:hypothetical protein
MILTANRLPTTSIDRHSFASSFHSHNELESEFAQEVLGLSREELRRKLINATKSEFLSILQLGATEG